MQPQGWQLIGIMILCAELLLIVAKSAQIQVIAKPAHQRTAAEQRVVERGIVRSLAIEALLFVPASVVLVFIVVRPLILSAEPFRHRAENLSVCFALHGSLGLVSYGFPFGMIKTIISRIALNTLKEFATIAHTPLE